jgi:hypothetical protein
MFDKGLMICFLLHGHALCIWELQLHWNYEINQCYEMLGTLRTHSYANKKQTSLCEKSKFHSQHWQSSCIWSMLDSIELWAFDNSWFKNEIQNSEKCDFWGFQSPKWGNKKIKITRFEYVIFIV